jgi:S1-C subfamily serine protease
MVTGLPDFTTLVERYGPAVVNVQVTEERQHGSRRCIRQETGPGPLIARPR